MRKFLLFSCLLLSICVLSQSQFYERQLVSPAGDYFADGNIEMTWVIGDLVIGAYDIGQLIVPYGTDVPYDESVLSVKIFPNPTTGKVYLQIQLESIEKCSYRLYDILGREIQNGNIITDRTELNLIPFESGVYLLRLIYENTMVQDFKIVKQ